MTAYLIAMYDIADEQAHQQYAEAADKVLDKHQGSILAGMDAAIELDGESGHAGIVIAFPSTDAAKAFYADPDYQALKPLRDAGTQNTKIQLIDSAFAQ